MPTVSTNAECRAMALALHTDLTTINTYADKSPAVTLALVREGQAKIGAIDDYLRSLRTAIHDAAPKPNFDEAPTIPPYGLPGWDKIDAGTDQTA